MTTNDIWTIQKLLNWITEYFTENGIDPPRLSAELVLIAYNKTVHRLLSFPRKGLLPK